jgi:hypothetical protein
LATRLIAVEGVGETLRSMPNKTKCTVRNALDFGEDIDNNYNRIKEGDVKVVPDFQSDPHYVIIAVTSGEVEHRRSIGKSIECGHGVSISMCS